MKLLVDGLRKEEIRCCDHTGMRMQLTAVAANLINLAGNWVFTQVTVQYELYLSAIIQ